MSLDPGSPIPRLILGVLDPGTRASAARDLAAILGAESLVLFMRDPELGIPLPAPGFPQVLSDARAWQALATAAARDGSARGNRLPCPLDGSSKAAVGSGIEDGTALVLLGGDPREEALSEVRDWLPWVSQVLRAENAQRAAKAKEELALVAVRTSNRMSATLEGMRTTLEQALRKAETEQRKARREEEERQKFVFLVENSSESIGMAGLDGKIFYMNPHGCGLIGLDSPDAARGLSIEDLLTEEFRAAFADMVLPAVHAHGHWEGEVLFGHRRGGEPIPVLQALFLVRDAATRAPLCIASVARDMTARKRAEDALKRTEAQLQHSQRMESIGKLAGGVAHDFNNLLTAINGFADLAMVQLGEGHPVHDHLAEIRGAGERAASLTRQLLAYSRKQVLATKVIELNAVVAGMHNLLRRLIGEDIAFSVSSQPGLGRVKADPGQLEQVILNLVVNARDATPGGGRITIETMDVDLDETAVAVHPEILPGPYVLLAVSDTGSGMEPHVKARVFEPFFTTKEFGRGSGMGLSMVQGIVTQSGGYIYVYSEPGRGSTFKVYLPRVEAGGSVAPAPEARGDFRGHETILIAEDEEAVRKLARGILEMQGYTVLEAGDGIEAERRSQGHPGAIDLLLTDVVMPRRNGRELAERILAARPGIGIVFMSGYTDDAIVRHGLLQRDTRFLQKPFTPDRLVRTVRECLNGALRASPAGPIPAGPAR